MSMVKSMMEHFRKAMSSHMHTETSFDENSLIMTTTTYYENEPMFETEVDLTPLVAVLERRLSKAGKG